ncbi:alpha-N-arabinofuranosidase [Pseudothermotoga sp. U03pept]|uniref:alpha-N-arabinofuranosidase n=1 Tax=Pseudothermotoga sp. U03pept TaxID=3447012 RepID=UPI003F0D4C40
MDGYVKVWKAKAGRIDEKIYGHFIEHLGRCIYGGIYERNSPLSDQRGFRKDVLAAVKKIRCPILRWPGGNFASAYHWEDGIGPVEKRPKLLNYIWGGIETNEFGTDEFVQYCKDIGTEPYLAVSLGTGTLDEAIHWLEYCNLDTPTKYASLRKQFGHDQPYKVKYWGIGNEVYGPWQVGHCSASEYAEKLRQFAQFMKAVDPSIKIIAVGADNPEWDMTVLKHAGALIDYISIHQYHGSEDHYETISAAYYVQERLKLLESEIKHLKLDHVKIALDEWNVWYQVVPEKEASEKGIVLLEEPYTLKDALFAAGIFFTLHRMSETVQMANLAQMVNALGMIKTNKEGLVLTPLYHVFDIFVNHTGRTRLGMDINSDTYSIKAKSFFEGRLSFQLNDVPYIDGSATYDNSRGLICLALANYYKDKDAEVEVDLSEFEFSKEIDIVELNADDVLAGNDFDNPNRVQPVVKRMSVPGPVSSVKLPAHSLIVMKIPVEEI